MCRKKQAAAASCDFFPPNCTSTVNSSKHFVSSCHLYRLITFLFYFSSTSPHIVQLLFMSYLFFLTTTHIFCRLLLFLTQQPSLKVGQSDISSSTFSSLEGGCYRLMRFDRTGDSSPVQRVHQSRSLIFVSVSSSPTTGRVSIPLTYCHLVHWFSFKYLSKLATLPQPFHKV